MKEITKQTKKHETDEKKTGVKDPFCPLPRFFFRFLLFDSLLFVCFVIPSFSLTFAQSPAKSLTGYNIITVEAVTVEKTPKAEKFTDEFASQFQQRIVDQFRKKKVFLEVIYGTSKIDSAPVDPAIKHLILTTTIIEFDPGNKALRYTIGWGAGSTKVKAKFVFRDAATKQELLITTYQGKFLGFINVIGKGNHPVNEASGDVIDGLIREINKNR